MNYERRGSGAPLVLIHGIGSRWQAWEPTLDLLAEHFDVIAVDLPGFGASPIPDDGTLTIDWFADAVERLCAELGVEHPHVAGNSMGGGIAIELGKRGFARSVTTYSPIGFWHRPGLLWARSVLRCLRMLGRLLRPALPALVRFPLTRVLIFGFVVGKPLALDPDVALADAHAMLYAPGFDRAFATMPDYRVTGADQLPLPVTIAWGSRDILLFYPTQSRRARKTLPAATHVTLRGSGHVPFSDDPRGCADVLIATARRA